MNSQWVILLVGFLYVVLFGGLSVLRREGLSIRFAVEAVLFTLSVYGVVSLTGTMINPVVFLMVLYLITIRVRLLVDVGTYFALRKKFEIAEKIFNLAEALFPDPTNRLIVSINRGVCRLQQQKLDEAIAIFKNILQNENLGYLGIKNEAASHYNMGIAFRRKGAEAQAIVEFNTVLDTWPASEHARYAAAALSQKRQRQSD